MNDKKSPETVFIIDDDDAVRDALGMLISSAGLHAEQYGSASRFLEEYDPNRPGCLLLDIRMPGMSGLELQQHLKERGTEPPIIFITGHGDIPMAVQATKRGAFDFVQKPVDDDELLERIHEALDTNRRQVEEEAQRQHVRDGLARLTPRERQVMEMVIEGKANKVIAIDLGVSQRTVEIHRARVMEKMRARSLAQLVRMVVTTG